MAAQSILEVPSSSRDEIFPSLVGIGSLGDRELCLLFSRHEGGNVISTSSASLDPMISTSSSVRIGLPLRVVECDFPFVVGGIAAVDALELSCVTMGLDRIAGRTGEFDVDVIST